VARRPDTGAGQDTVGRIVLWCQPGARQTRVAGLHDGKPKIQLQAPPVDGEANKALIGFLAEILAVPKSAITIALGASSRTKRVEVAGVSDDELSRRLSGPA
jgi:uncharacterized protein